MQTTRRSMRAFVAVTLIASAIVSGGTTAAVADTLVQDFESFTVGSPDGQQGWQFTGPYDVAIADPTSFGVTGMGSRALRISNASTSGSFGDWAFSEDLGTPAGEPSSDGGGMTGSGTPQPRFVASFDLASAEPNALQPDLQFSLAPDRGDGARMSFLRFNDTAGGIDVTFSDYVDRHTQGPGPGACTGSDNFRSTTIAGDLDRSQIHSVRIVMDFLDGRANDRVAVYVDGALAHAGTSWEDYFRDCESNPTRPVDSLIFQARTGAGTAPATAGKGFLIDSLDLSSGATRANETAGTWSSEVATKALVKPPINADGTSNFPKRRGVIPVQFELATKVDDGVLESILSDADPGNDFGFLSFQPSQPLSFYELDRLVAAYEFTLGDCVGGSLRWSVGVDTTGDGIRDGSVFIYYGGMASFTECTSANDGSGLNMIGTSEARYDLGQFGGPFYGTYAEALGVLGTDAVTRASLVLDSGWATTAGQRVIVTSAGVDDEGYTPSVTNPTGYVRTCDLPQARLRWSKNDPVASGAINEGQSIQPSDTGEFYRIVDCKYIYNLDVSVLDPDLGTRAGTYRVWVNIDGENIANPAKFDLR